MDSIIPLSFGIINVAIMPLWFGLLFFPRRKIVNVAIDVFIAAAAFLYVVTMTPGLPQALPVILRPTLESVGQLLATPPGTLLSWTHFIIGDLWAGRWIGHDAHVNGISRVWVVPILVLTLLFGPIGYLTYFAVKLALRRRFGTDSPLTNFS